LAEAAAELVAARVDVIVAGGEPATRIAMQATSQIPIVFIYVPDPVDRGLIGSIARPAGNLTGFAMLQETMLKNLEVLRELMPAAQAVAYLFDPANVPEPILARQFEQHSRVATSLGLSYREFRVRSRADIETAIEDAKAAAVDAIIVEGSPDLVGNRFVVTRLANRNGIPVIGRERQFATAEALITFGELYHDLQSRAAEYVDRLLRGARVSELPVQFTTRLELVVNLKAARFIGIGVPPSLLARADEVVE
jgi:putative ABC transport system substrate-binding protein